MSKLKDSIDCILYNVPANVVDSISSSIGLSTRYIKNKKEISFSCSITQANDIHLKFSSLIHQNPQIWLSINLPSNPKHKFIQFNTNIGEDIRVSFGSLLSTSKFLIHDISYIGAPQWTMTLSDQNTLQLKCQNTVTTTICFTLSICHVEKHIFVIDYDTRAEIIINMNKLIKEVQMTDNMQSSKLYGDQPLIKSISLCSEILIRISPKSVADQFLNYLRNVHRCKILYTKISIEQNVRKLWDKIEFNWYPTRGTSYAMAMLHSLGYVFDDKYLMNDQLQSTLVDLAEENEERFYQLALQAFRELQACHWFDLTTIFNRDEFNKIAIKNKSKLFRVGVVHITPTRLCIMPKEETIGHRAMRHESFGGADNFCLVYLKPDPPNQYLNNNTDNFRQIFRAGIEIGRDRFHLFGSSNSQIKEHVFWFMKTSTLNDVHQKRSQLGELNQIDNLGTYAARLGLWFSKSSPTGIKLVYCETEQEFNKRVLKGEICVRCIDDIERNGFCFTDGNGFISKGLVKRFTENIPIMSSAYQIRMAGCKGLLIIDPQSTNEQFYIKIRPSMKKFECNDWTLEICEHSVATPTRLNNQIILLMSDLGVPNETFLRLQEQWFQNAPSNYIYSEHLLKNKIPLPENECRFMFGCAFETILKPGTCFIRYEVLDHNGKSLPNRQYKCVEGQVIVTKNPCPYAGDMLVLNAVDRPELYDLHDIIVFSTKGDRPDFHKIAGSDLDGDKYFVYWGSEFKLQYSVPPLDYAADKKIIHPTPISAEDIIDYYLSTLGATSYGEVYNLHAVVVDQNSEGHRQRTCQSLAIELARMFASAIDSGKTGYTIDKSRIQSIREQYGQKYPDFLMKYGRLHYISQSIVGILYRNAVLYKKGRVPALNQAVTSLTINDNNLNASTSRPLSSLPVNSTSARVKSGTKKSAVKSTTQSKSVKK